MAEGEGSKDSTNTGAESEAGPANGAPLRKADTPTKEQAEEEDDDDDEDEEEEEPELKYATVTKRIGPIFRNGDAVSSFLVSGDKMVIWSLKTAFVTDIKAR